MTDKIVKAHVQPHTSHYNMHFPEHGTREGDPYYKLFEAYRQKAKHDPELYQCWLGKTRGDFSDCTLDKPLELHHRYAEWALLNEIDLDMARKQHPQIQTRDDLDRWLESEENLIFLCQFHHRGHGGAHVATASDWVGQLYVKHLID